MNAEIRHKRYKNYLERKYKKLIEEAYNVQYTDHSLSDILTYDALRLRHKLSFFQL